MAGRKKGGNTAALVRELAEPIAARFGCQLWDVRFVKEGAEGFLRVFIDKPGGVSIDDCVDVTRALNDPLDELDPIDREYCLEVCSPGLGRELTRLIRPLPDGRRELRGTLLGLEDGVVTVQPEGGGDPVALDRAAASKIRLLDDEDLDGGNE